MLLTLMYPDSDGELDVHASTVSAEHFLNLTTGLFTGDDCIMFLLGANSRREVLSYRMRVSGVMTRRTPERDLAGLSAASWDGEQLTPSAVSDAFRKLAARIAR